MKSSASEQGLRIPSLGVFRQILQFSNAGQSVTTNSIVAGNWLSGSLIVCTEQNSLLNKGENTWRCLKPKKNLQLTKQKRFQKLMIYFYKLDNKEQTSELS